MPSIALPVSLRGQLLSGSRFNPISLFSAGEQGIWLDPSDLTTMYQDRAGTVPVTTPGQTVGLRLDKSKGLVLGAELVTNGDFATDTAWAKIQATTTISGGSLNLISPNMAGDVATQTISGLTSGVAYRVMFSVLNRSAGSFKFIVRNGANTATVVETIVGVDGDYSLFFVATGTSHFLRLQAVNTNTVLSIDNISVRELPGNHAVAPTDATRPTYGIEPKGGRRNLLTQTENFTNAFWGGPGSTVSANVTTAPNGTTTADKLAEQATSGNHLIYNVSGLTLVAGQYTDSIYLKAAERGFGFVQIATDNATKRYTVVVDLSTGAITATSSTGTPTGTASSVVSAGDGWWRVSVRADYTSNLAYILAGPVPTGVPTFDAFATPTYTGTAGSGILIWGAQLELGSTATNYQRVTTAYDITESGVATCHYVQYDGSDDSLSTSAIDFTGTDKMSVFAGVRKLSDATSAIAETSADIAANAGSFSLFNITSSSANQFSSRGSGTTRSATASPYTSPLNLVLSGLADISGDASILRINGAQVAQNVNDQGTGNFGNYPLFIGRRNNATLPFNGRDYGIVIVGKTASAGEITDTETWLAARTSGVSI